VGILRAEGGNYLAVNFTQEMHFLKEVEEVESKAAKAKAKRGVSEPAGKCSLT